MGNAYSNIFTLKQAWTALLIVLFCFFFFFNQYYFQVLSPQLDYEIFEGRDSFTFVYKW